MVRASYIYKIIEHVSLLNSDDGDAGGGDSHYGDVKQCDENCDDTCDNARIYITGLGADVVEDDLQVCLLFLINFFFPLLVLCRQLVLFLFLQLPCLFTGLAFHFGHCCSELTLLPRCSTLDILTLTISLSCRFLSPVGLILFSCASTLLSSLLPL